MHKLLTIIFLGVCTLVQAQKNELQIGTQGVYFFDSSPFRMHRMKAIPLPSVQYGRRIKDIGTVRIKYHTTFYSYSKEFYEKNEVMKREYHVILVSFLPNLYNFKHFQINPFAGLEYRFKGGELFHSSYYDFDNWTEQHSGFNKYNNIGFAFGIQPKVKIWKGLSVSLELDYTRYISKFSANRFKTSVFLGYEF